MMYSRTVVDRVIREGKALLMPDTRAEDEADRSVSMELMKVRSVLCVPLISRSQIKGVIYLDSTRTPFGFRKEDLSIVNALSIPAAVAIEQALLHFNEEEGKKD
jgi:GAF domain-containing protein